MCIIDFKRSCRFLLNWYEFVFSGVENLKNKDFWKLFDNQKKRYNNKSHCHCFIKCFSSRLTSTSILFFPSSTKTFPSDAKSTKSFPRVVKVRGILGEEGQDMIPRGRTAVRLLGVLPSSLSFHGSYAFP